MESLQYSMSERALFTDLYELTMLQGYFETGKYTQIATFEYHFRKLPFNSGYAVLAGIHDVLNYLNDFAFSESDLEYLVSLHKFSEKFLDFLKTFHFTGTIEFMPEGSVVFPYEPIVQITAPLGEAQLIESALLNLLNYQTLIATKSSRIVLSAFPNKVLEFGLRRAHGDASLPGARASVIAGCIGTSNVLAGKIFNLSVSGTHAHSWIMSFASDKTDVKTSELQAFRTYANLYPDDTILLVDTYDTLNSGVPNAVIVGKELKEKGHTLRGIRIDSGDLVWLAIESAKLLDKAGLTSTFIVLSNDLDEYIIESIQTQLKQRLDQANDKNKEFYDRLYRRIVYGVGTSLITGSGNDQSALGGVYKITEIDGKPVMKFSENIEKRTNPHQKNLWRIEKDNEFVADVIGLKGEQIPKSGDTIYHIFDPLKKFEIPEGCSVNLLYRKVDFSNLEDKSKKLQVLTSIDSWKTANKQLQSDFEKLNFSHVRLLNPHTYKVSLSEKLMKVKNDLFQN